MINSSEKNKIISIKFLLIFILTSSTCWGSKGEEERSYSITSLFKNCFYSMMCAPILTEKKKKKFHSSAHFYEGGIEALPTEIFHKICYVLCPPDILYLSMCSKIMMGKFDDSFWKNYLKVHKKEIWIDFLPPIKIAFAHSSYENGKMEKAAELGHPKAKRILKNRKRMQKQKHESYQHIRAFIGRENPLFILRRRCFLGPPYYNEIEERY